MKSATIALCLIGSSVLVNAAPTRMMDGTKVGPKLWKNWEVAAIATGVATGGVILNNYIKSEIKQGRLQEKIQKLRERPTTSGIA
jgi:hypothetical protein